MKTKLLLLLALVSVLCGCNTVRSGENVAKSVVNAGVAVKDDVFGAIEVLINAAESVKTNVINGASATANAATK